MQTHCVWLFVFMVSTPFLSAEEATIAWNLNPEPEVAGYKIHYGKSSRTYSSIADVGNVSQYTVRDLAPGTWYFAVSAYTAAGGESGVSDEASATIRPGPAPDNRPLILEQVSVSAVTHTSALIAWNTNKVAGGGVEFGVTTEYCCTVLSTSEGTTNSVKLTGLVPDTQYHFSVRTTDLTGQTIRAEDGLFTTAPTPDSIAVKSTLLRPLTPGRDGDYGGFAISNLDSVPAFLRFTARDTSGAPVSGPAITNPVALRLEPGAQIAVFDEQIFGDDFAATAPNGTIRIESSTSRTSGFFLVFDGALSVLDGTNVPAVPVTSFVFPSVTATESNLNIANPAAALALITLELISPDGVTYASATHRVDENGALAAQLAELFPNARHDVTYYLRGVSNVGVFPFLMERGAGYLESLSGLTTTGFTATLIAPQYSVGDGWNSTLSVVNLDGLPGQLKVTFMRDNGTPAAQSRVLSVPAHGLVAIDGKIFITEAGLSPFHGYAVIEGYGLSLAGSVRIGDANGNDFSTQLPLANAPESSVVFSQIASGSVFYTGLTILNPGLLDASVTLELYSQAGKLEASRTDVLPARQRRSKLLTEYFPELAGKERNGGYLRLKADPGVASFALIGTQSRSVLSALPGVRTR